MSKFTLNLFANNGFAIDSAANISRLYSSWMPGGIFLFHQGRCGSTILADLLGQHPKIRSNGEIFNPFHGDKKLPTTPKNMLMGRRAIALKSYTLVEAKFFECQHLAIFNSDIEEFVGILRESGFDKFIILSRKNFLRKLLSILVAKKRGNKWHIQSTEDKPPVVKVHLDTQRVCIQGKCAPIVEMFDYMDRQYEKLREALRGENVLEIAYEDHIYNDPQIAYLKVCDWLNIDSYEAKIRYQKSVTDTPVVLVDNWEEVVEKLKDTQYFWMVH